MFKTLEILSLTVYIKEEKHLAYLAGPTQLQLEGSNQLPLPHVGPPHNGLEREGIFLTSTLYYKWNSGSNTTVCPN